MGTARPIIIALLLGALVAERSQAAFIVDTGEPGTGGDNRFLTVKFAGEFAVDHAVTITSVEHFMLIEAPGMANLVLCTDAGDVPGPYYRQTYNRYYPAGPSGWRGVSGLAWDIPAGTYWIGIDPQFGGSLIGRTFLGAPNPLLNEAKTISGQHGAPWYAYDALNLGWRIDATATPGGHENHPILPATGGGGDPFVFDGVPGDGRWFDPPPATGYLYETDGASNFVQVGLPVSVPDADGLYTVSDSVNGTFVVAAGAFHTFDTSVNSFTVLGIEPAVDGGDPLAFPTFLQFDQATVNFTMMPIPEPAALLLLVFGGVALVRRRRRV